MVFFQRMAVVFFLVYWYIQESQLLVSFDPHSELELWMSTNEMVKTLINYVVPMTLNRERCHL